jgi:hypothetical protein
MDNSRVWELLIESEKGAARERQSFGLRAVGEPDDRSGTISQDHGPSRIDLADASFGDHPYPHGIAGGVSRPGASAPRPCRVEERRQGD